MQDAMMMVVTTMGSSSLIVSKSDLAKTLLGSNMINIFHRN
jgi:hypothetical protein